MKYVIATVFFLLMEVMAFFKYQTIQHEKRMVMAEMAYDTGCYQFAQGFCSTLEEQERLRCYDVALEECEPNGKKFRAWIESGK